MKDYLYLLKLGFPIMIGQLGIIILSFADTMMVGRYGTDELAAASFTNNIFNLIIIFATGFSYGLTPVVGRLFGQNDKEAIGKTLKNGICANTVMGIILTAIMGLFYFSIGRLNQPEELLPIIRPYYLILLTSLVFILIFNAFKQFCDGVTDTTTPMWILLAGNTMNIIGNYLLIYGKAGLPELGLAGAGISTLISRIFMVVAIATVFFTSQKYSVYRKGFRESRLNRQDFKELNHLGLPVALQMGMETASFSLSTIMVGWLGTIALASHQVMLTVGQLGYMLYYGMAAAVSIRISVFHGQHDMKNIRRTSSIGIHIILTMAFIVSTTIFLLRNQIGSWFSSDQAVQMMVAQLVIPFIIYQLGDGMQCNFSNCLRGIEDVKPVMAIAFIAYFIICLPCGYLFGFVLDWGITGIWLSYPLGLTSAGILFYLRFKSQTKKSGLPA